MAYQAPLRRSLLPLLFILTLTTCSTDALDVDRGERVAAIRKHPHRKYLPQQQTEAAYPDATLNNDVPALEGAPERKLPMIDSEEAMVGQESGTELQGDGGQGMSQQSLGAPPRILGQLHSQPEMQQQELQQQDLQSEPVQMARAATQAGSLAGEGINIDDGLGVAQSQSGSAIGSSLAQEEAMQIAETNTQEPVIAGIGTDNPVAYGGQQARPQAVEQPVSDTLDAGPQSYPQAATDDQLLAPPVSTPRRPRYSGGQQVAMLPRPIDPTIAPQMTPQPGVMPASERACRVALQQMGVKFQDVTPIYNGPTCGIPYPIKVYGFASKIAMKPAITLNCQVTLAFSKWVKNELNPSARARYWSGVRTIIPMGGYSCRRMNSSSRNPWSEHARGNAIDVGKFVLNSGKEIDVRKPGFFSFREKGLLNAVRSDSCRYFHTVLGPGSDPHHKDHFHFDLRARKSGYRHCD